MARKQDLTKIRIEYDKANAKYTKTVAAYQADPTNELITKRYRKAKSDLAVARRTYNIHRDQIRADAEGDAAPKLKAIAAKPTVTNTG